MLGPFELQDFDLYFTLRFGYPPPKVAFFAYCAWRDRTVRHLPVIDADRRLVGLVTDHDLRQALLGPAAEEPAGVLVEAFGRVRVNEVMTWGVVTVGPASELRQAARIMRERGLGALPVVTEGRVIGIVTATDVIGALVGQAARGP